MGKGCSYALCTSRESSKTKTVKGAEGVFFVKFPSPKTEPERCEKWITACGRPNFSVLNIDRWKYICSRHFHGFRGPTPATPDPIPLHEVLSPQLFKDSSKLSSQKGNTRRRMISLNPPSDNVESQVTEAMASDLLTSLSPCLDFQSVVPPLGWALQYQDGGALFFKRKNDFTVIKWFINFNYNQPSLKVLDKMIDIKKIVPAFNIKSNGDIYATIKQLDKYTICPGNPDEDLVNLYRNNIEEFDPRIKSFFCDKLKTVYSEKCERFIQKSANRPRCSACSGYRGSLRRLRWRAKTVPKPRSAKRKKEKSTCSSHLVKLSKNRLIHLEKNKKEVSNITKILKTRINDSPSSFTTLFMQQQLKAMKTSNYGMKWDPLFLNWCVYMKNKSKKSYEALRKSKTLFLPTTRTLYNHTHILNNKPGFNKEVFLQLMDETNINNLPEHEKYFVILLDEVKDLGCNKNTVHINEDINKLDEMERGAKGNSTLPLATHTLQLTLRSLTSGIKVPFAHFPTNGERSSDLYAIVWEAVEKLEWHNFRILGIVGDGASSNKGFFQICVGTCEEETIGHYTTNIFAMDEERHLFFVSDAPHLVKMVRNCFANSGCNAKSRNLWIDGEELTWDVIVQMYYLQLKAKEDLKQVPKLMYEHVFLKTNSKTKISLAAEVLSETVASSIENLLEDKDNPKYIQTVKFIRVFDKFFEICNVKNHKDELGNKETNKGSFDSLDDERLKWLEEDFIAYLNDWKEQALNRLGNFSALDRAKMQLSQETIQGLQITALSTVKMVKFLLRKGAPYVLTQHLNQDPLDQEFGKHRATGGRKYNSSVKLYESNLDKLKSLKSLMLETINGNTSRDIK